MDAIPLLQKSLWFIYRLCVLCVCAMQFIGIREIWTDNIATTQKPADNYLPNVYVIFGLLFFISCGGKPHVQSVQIHHFQTPSCSTDWELNRPDYIGLHMNDGRVRSPSLQCSDLIFAAGIKHQSISLALHPSWWSWCQSWFNLLHNQSTADHIIL